MELIKVGNFDQVTFSLLKLLIGGDNSVRFRDALIKQLELVFTNQSKFKK